MSWPEFAFAPLVGRVIMQQQVRTVRRCGILAWLPPAHLLSSLIVTANTKANLDTNTNLHANTKANANTQKIKSCKISKHVELAWHSGHL